MPWLRLLPWVLLAAAAQASTATDPVPLDAAWLLRHEGFVQEARAGGIDLLFLGDSIIDYWRYDSLKGIPRGKKIWDADYAPRHAVNFGISGDRTQHLLWRLQHGELDGLQPRAVILMIGSNNTGLNPDKVTPRNSPEEIIAGVRANLAEIRKRLPQARILLLAILPRGPSSNLVWAQLRTVNPALAGLADGRQVRYLDLLPGLLGPDGELSPAALPDLSHPSETGFRIWAQEMAQPLADLLR